MILLAWRSRFLFLSVVTALCLLIVLPPARAANVQVICPGEAEAAEGNTKEPVATSVYLTLGQLEKVDRLIAKRQVEDSAKLGRHVSKMSFADFIRLLIDELPE